MRRPVRVVFQALLIGGFTAFVGVFSSWPSVKLLEPDQGLLRLSFTHPGQFVTDCRQRTPEELAKLPPQLRAAQDCPRERSPVHVIVDVDGKPLVDEVFPPRGFRRDGAASGYGRYRIAAGTHDVRVAVNDDVRVKGPTHVREAVLKIAPGQVVLIDFQTDKGGVIIQ
jgi:hypothetical protein